MLDSMLFARIFVCSASFLMGMVILNPLMVFAVFIIVRVLIQGYAFLQYTLVSGIPISSSLSLVIILSSFITTSFRKGTEFFPAKIIPLLVFVYLSTGLSFLTDNYYASAAALIKIMTFLGLYYLVYNGINDLKDCHRVLIPILVSSIFPVIHGIYQSLTSNVYSYPSRQYISDGRINSVLADPNTYGLYLALIFIAALMIYLIDRKRIYLYYSYLLLCVIVIARNRGTWIALALGCIVASALYRRKISKLHALAVVIVLLGLGTPIVVNRFIDLEKKDAYGQSQNTFAGRVEYSIALIKYSMSSPLLGHGPGSSEQAALESIGHRVAPHNDYVRLAVEVGYPCMFLYLFFLFSELWRCIRLSIKDELWEYNLPMLMMQTVLVVLSFASNIFYDLVNFSIYISVLAMVHKARQLTSTPNTQNCLA